MEWWPDLWVQAVVVLVGCGLAGGGLNCLAERKPPARPLARYITRRLVEGVVAALIVPLFLSVIGNDIVPTILKAGSAAPDIRGAFLKLAGFGLVAALYSRRFLESVSARVLNLEQEMDRTRNAVEAAKEQADEATKAVETLADAVVEEETPAGRPPLGKMAPEVGELEERLLQTFLQSPVPARSTNGIVADLDVPHAEAVQALQGLLENGLVRSIETPRGSRWALTALGRDAAVRWRATVPAHQTVQG